MVLFLNEEYETIYWRSSMANGAIIVWNPSEGPVKDLLLSGGRIVYEADSPECLAYQCCPSPYSLKCITESFAQEYGTRHPSPKLPPESVLNAVKDDLPWWKQLARDSERFARYVGEGAPRKYFMEDATVVLKEMWRRTLGPWKDRHDDESVEMRLIRYLRSGRMSEYPRDLAIAVMNKLRTTNLLRGSFDDMDCNEANRLWELTAITPNTKLDESLKRSIQSLRAELRKALRYRESHPRAYALLPGEVTTNICRFTAALFEALEADDPKNPSLEVEKISDVLGKLEDKITRYSETAEKIKGNAALRDGLAELLHCRRSLHEKLTRGGYSISNDGYTVAKQFVPSKDVWR